jgi:hypothetical protein
MAWLTATGYRGDDILGQSWFAICGEESDADDMRYLESQVSFPSHLPPPPPCPISLSLSLSLSPYVFLCPSIYPLSIPERKRENQHPCLVCWLLSPPFPVCLCSLQSHPQHSVRRDPLDFPRPHALHRSWLRLIRVWGIGFRV